MVIRRLAIRNFGKIHKKTLELKPGINVLYGENESGKTTVHTFIKSMLYGMTRSRGRGAKTDTFARYEPWENPSDYGGVLWFENGGRTFRLTRTFAKERARAELYCEDDGELLNLDTGDMDMLLGGVSETVYENTVSIAQLKSVTGKELVAELQNYMASYEGTGDASIDLGRAIQMLKMTRKGFQVQRERALRVREEEKAKLMAERDYVLGEIEELNERRSVMEAQHAQADEGTRKDQEAVESYLALLDHRQKLQHIALAATGAGTLLLMLLAGLCLPGALWAWFLPLFAGGVLLSGEFLYGRRIQEERAKSRKIQRRLKKKMEKQGWDRAGMEENLKEKETSLGNLEAELREYESMSPDISAPQMEISALNLAMGTMETLTRQFRERVGDGLRERVSQILCEITDGRYREVLIDSDFQIRVNTEDRIVPAESLSRGTLEQIYFALRMAAGKLLCGEECFPVILDDVFGMYDEERLCAVLRYLAKEPRQVIISTCGKREAQLLKREGIPFHLISMEELQ